MNQIYQKLVEKLTSAVVMESLGEEVVERLKKQFEGADEERVQIALEIVKGFEMEVVQIKEDGAKRVQAGVEKLKQIMEKIEAEQKQKLEVEKKISVQMDEKQLNTIESQLNEV